MLANVLLALLVVFNCRFEWRKSRKCLEQISDLKGHLVVQKHRASILKARTVLVRSRVCACVCVSLFATAATIAGLMLFFDKADCRGTRD